MRRGDGARDLDAPEVVHIVHIVYIMWTIVGVDDIPQVYVGCSLDYLRRWQATDEMPTCVACIAQALKAPWGASPSTSAATRPSDR